MDNTLYKYTINVYYNTNMEGVYMKQRELIKKLKKVSTIPLITKVSEHINRRDLINKHLAGPLEHILYYDIIAQNIYELCQKSPVPKHDFLASPIYIQR